MNSMYFNRFSRAITKRKSASIAAATAFATLLGLSTASTNASTILTDGNSSVTLTNAAVTNWTVGTTNELGQESFWYRIGSSGGQSPISNLTPVASTTVGSGFAKYTYGSTSGFQVVVKYNLTGGQSTSLSSDLGETVTVNNDGMSSQTFHLFEYTNFNLGGSTTGQTVTITGGNTATDIGNGLDSVTSVSPKSSEFAASNTAASPDLLTNISSSTKSFTLPNVTSAAEGDGEWAFEWDITIGCNSSYIISIDKNIKALPITPAVPEPVSGTIALLGLGGLAMMRPRRRGAIA